MKNVSAKQLKKRAWAYASKWKRLKESKKGYCKCVTCGVIKHWKNIDAGHFVSGRNNSILFDERNFHPQCAKCNRFKESWPEYYRWMLENYGQVVIDELLKKKWEVKLFSDQELLDLIASYKADIQDYMRAL